MEVECKLALLAEEVEGLRARLAALGAVGHPGSDQEDVYFSHPARDLVASDEAFRLRRDGALELTYKGPRSPSDLKERPELNVRVEDDPTPLLEALGFRPTARLVKRRETWALERCDVAIDRIDGLGWFVEIEAHAHDPRPAQAIERVREQLGLTHRQAITDSYLGMALAQDAAGVQRLA